jgi:hypothetical protein
MSVSIAAAIVPMNYIGPALGAVVFIAIMSLVPHPARRSFNAIFAAGAVGAYIGGGFGPWELIYPVLATPVVYLGLRSYRRSASHGSCMQPGTCRITYTATRSGLSCGPLPLAA